MQATRPPVLVAPRGAQLLGLAFRPLNAFIVRVWRLGQHRRLLRVIEQMQAHAVQTRGRDLAALRVELAGLNR
jgi:hypothetical protein